MIFVCPKPDCWHKIYLKLLDASKECPNLKGSVLPTPLILGGWNFSNSLEKSNRWKATLEWADLNNLSHIIPDISVEDQYIVNEISSYPVGPYGGPIKLSWNYEAKTAPDKSFLKQAMQNLKKCWVDILESELANNTTPLKFSGTKKRCLIVSANKNYNPKWGRWDELNDDNSRRHFTKMRSSVNKVISPHEVDHICFKIEK